MTDTAPSGGPPASGKKRLQPQRPVLPHAKPARPKRRHRIVVYTFISVVLMPFLISAVYLFAFAQDQYASTVAFTVRSEENNSASDFFGGLTRTLGSSGGHDSDILYEFIQSQDIVQNIDDKIDLRTLFSIHKDSDPFFSFQTDGTIEDLTEYWKRMLHLSYDSGSGLMIIRVNAFRPEDAYQIAQAILVESQAVINDISATARADATRYTEEDLERAETRLREARQELTDFRVTNQIVDPTKDIEGQMGLLNTLQSQLATALIDFDLLAITAQPNDPRLEQTRRRIDVTRKRIAEERNKFSGESADGDNYAAKVSEFEKLSVDYEFAQMAYTAARSAHDAALGEARRTTRYLATFITPTLAERSMYPARGTILMLVGLFLFLGWTILLLIYYSLRDRR
ncbi:sugar transporter [Celeribacter ethanolicus]|uniref:sugar transporter n=1 Tax=Celeribacter ethanolicus TaxID=1758178 RepID=UPI001FD43DA4|nr:sugar transporter [Celeribacter ethanolicus]